MKPLLWLACLVFLPMQGLAVDLANGEFLNRGCAMCHGLHGQGAPGPYSPRMAGMDKDYLVKATREYRDDDRSEITMAYATGLKLLTDQDIEDVSAYLAQLEIPAEVLIDVKTEKGNPDIGKSLYKDCKSCHGSDGMGKPGKNVPRLAGQHVGFLLESIRLFKLHERQHGIDPEDQLQFDDLNSENIDDLMAYVATLDDADYLAAQQGLKIRGTDIKQAEVPDQQVVAVERPTQASDTDAETHEQSAGLQIIDTTQTVVRLQIQSGVTPEDAELAMLSTAAGLNLKLVGEQAVSRELRLRGEHPLYLKILQFCNPQDAIKMVEYNPIFASYMPCSIAVVEDQDGKYWVMMMNLELLIGSKLMPPEVSEIAIRINQSLLKVMVAGASGEF
jgi:cytochrome c553/uncharacterized protein (DUF302 family)